MYPNKYKVCNGRTKFLLRLLSENKLPNIISSRKKHGFAIPLAKMMRGPLKEKIEDFKNKINGQVLRLALISAHYKQSLDWNDKLIEECQNTINKWSWR